MKSYRFGPVKGKWTVVTTWLCKYGEHKSLCVCCIPKNAIAASTVGRLSPELREYFSQTDGSRKSRTPRSSRRIYRFFEFGKQRHH